MTEIELDAMAGALKRWQDFGALNPPTAGPVVEPGRDPEIGRSFAYGIDWGDSEALRAQAASVGLTRQARLAFRLAMREALDELQRGKVELEAVAYAGLIVGLMASQLADDAEGRGGPG
jgi:aminoglycoside phosphotransferase (APT) family kinase protein